MDLSPLLFMLIAISISEGHDGKCSVDPKDPYIEVGSSIKVVCKTSCVHGETFWTVKNRPVDESWSQTINSTHVVLTLRNFTHRSAMVECRSVETQQPVAGVIIATYEKPRNIFCILHYDNTRIDGIPPLLTCSWKHQIRSTLKVIYTVLCSSSLHTSPIEICKSEETTCTMRDLYTSEKFEYLFGENFKITVRGKTDKWEVYSDPIEFNPYQILKINPPKFAVTTFSDHLLVECAPLHMFEKRHCQINCRKAASAEERTPVWVWNKTFNPEQDVTIRVEEELQSCTNYRLSVRCALHEAPWSDWSQEKTILTKLNKSQIRLRLWRKVTEEQSDGVRKVYAMWMGIPSSCPGRFNYEIKQTPYQQHAIQGSQMYTLCGSSTCNVTVNRDARRINLTVSYDEDPLAEDSVYVPAVGESLPQVTNIQTSSRDGVITVNWTAPNQPVSGYMIDWTHNGSQYYWEESKYTHANLFVILDKEPYNITVTPLFDGKTGHGAQVLRVCSRIGDPGIVVITSIQAHHKSADVRWDTQLKGACGAAFVSYMVFYGTQDGPLLNITGDSEKRNVILKNLNPDTQYRVYVEATALTGMSTSTETLFKTNTFDPNLITVLTVCGCFIIVLVLSLGLCCAIQWKRFRDKPVPNPALSSVASWLSSSHQKGMCLFQPFGDPSESTFDTVYTEQTPNSSTASLTISTNGNTTSDQNGKYADSVTTDPVMTQHSRLSEETTAFLPSESNPGSPYRSQSSVETRTPKTGEQCKHVPGKQREKMPLETIYVTLDMFEHDQTR